VAQPSNARQMPYVVSALLIMCIIGGAIGYALKKTAAPPWVLLTTSIVYVGACGLAIAIAFIKYGRQK
jgi:hypothetical protein